jgi:tetratricopeptide (TPR) repeat protein
MTTLRLEKPFSSRAVFVVWRHALVAGMILALSSAHSTVAASRSNSSKSKRPATATKGTPAAAGRPAPNAPDSLAHPAGIAAEPWLSDLRPAAPDLALPRKNEQKAEALAAFAQGLLAEDNAETEKALAGYRKALENDPGYAELAVKVAYELARRNDVSGGIQVLKDAIKAAPKEPLPLIYLSQLYSKHLKKPELAMKYAEQALALAPDNLLCHSALFELYVAGGQPKKAEQALERAARIENDDPKFWLQLGELYTRLYLKEDGSSAPAELQRMNMIYRRAAELGKDDASVLAKVGDYFVLSRQVKEAIPVYRAALTARTHSGESPPEKVRDKLARALLVNQQRDEAIEVLEELTKEQPMRFETQELLAELYEQKGDIDQALAHYEHGLSLDASEPKNYLHLTSMLLRAKRFDKAVETMRDARKRFPDLPQITFSLALSLSKAKRHAEAMTTFAEAQTEAQNTHEELLTADFYLEYGAAAEQAGETDKAAELLKRAIELDPQNAAQAYNYLGYMWVDRGENLEEAGEMIRKAVEMEPENAAFIDSLGWFYFKKGEHEKALKELLRAAENLKPDDAVVFDHIGDAYLALGKTPEALLYWQKALALEKENKKISEKIEVAKQKVTSHVPPAPDPVAGAR